MRLIAVVSALAGIACAARPTPPVPLEGGDRIVEIAADVAAGFHFPYILALPHDAEAQVPPYLLVETNNTAGGGSPDFEAHRRGALKVARGPSVGSFVARALNTPLLVPVFPRPPSRLYTHALDRDTLEIRGGRLKRLDVQLVAMIDDATKRLRGRGIFIGDRVLLNGFSASGTFANRFTFLHAHRVRAVACGGVNGVLMLPFAALGGLRLPYPVGVADVPVLTGSPLALDVWRNVPQLAYMGARDENDAVAFDDAYSAAERRAIHLVLGRRMQPDRWRAVQDAYRSARATVTFRTYDGIGHGTNGTINREVADFFRSVIAAE